MHLLTPAFNIQKKTSHNPYFETQSVKTPTPGVGHSQIQGKFTQHVEKMAQIFLGAGRLGGFLPNSLWGVEVIVCPVETKARKKKKNLSLAEGSLGDDPPPCRGLQLAAKKKCQSALLKAR